MSTNQLLLLLCSPLLDINSHSHSITFQVDIKENGKARICLDLSSPHRAPGENKQPGRPCSVNDGIDKQKYRCRCASLQDICSLVHSLGFPAVCAKSDWTSAYKHLPVRPDDLCLQVLQWGGRYFVELMLTFGASSSPYLYSQVAEFVKVLAAKQAATPPYLLLRCLDDLMNFGPTTNDIAHNFWSTYRSLCEEVGVSLADTSDAKKSFSPVESGELLGMEYNLTSGTCRIPESKLNKILCLLVEVLAYNTDPVPNPLLAQLVGKVVHYSVTIQHGAWERGFISALPDGGAHSLELGVQRYCHSSNVKQSPISIPQVARDQLKWWYWALQAGHNWSPIPDTRRLFPLVSVNLFTDAAGATDNSTKKPGAGGVFMDSSPPAFYCKPWGKTIRVAVEEKEGRQYTLGSKLTCLELLAVLIGISLHPIPCRNNALLVHVDNIGAVYAFKKRNCRDKLSYTVAKGIANLAQCLNCSVHLRHVPRRSCLGADLADDLSKGNFATSLAALGPDSVFCKQVPQSLSAWLEQPVQSRTLGHNIAADLHRAGIDTLEWE